MSAYLDAAVADGQTAFGLTDHGSLAGAIELYSQAKVRGIKPIIGCELYVDAFELRERQFPKHLTILAANRNGYEALVAANNLAHSQFYYRPRLTLQQLLDMPGLEDCYILTGCMSGILYEMEMADAVQTAVQLAKKAKGVFVEVMWHQSEEGDFQRQHDEYLDKALTLHMNSGLPFVLTNDCHYVTPEAERQHQDMLRRYPKAAGLEFDGHGFYLRTQQHMQAIADSLGIQDAWGNAAEIARQCDWQMPEVDKVVWKVPEVVADPIAAIRVLCWPVLEMRGHLAGRPLEYQERFEHEMSVLKESQAICNSYLVSHELVKWCLEQGIPAAARGSMAGSLVSHLLGITLEDPVKHKLSFERAVSPARPTIPDFDIDVSSARRGEVIAKLLTDYPDSSPISTFTHYGPRGAYRAILRQAGYGGDKINEASKAIPEDWVLPNGDKALDSIPAQMQADVATYEGQFSSMSVHPAGYLLGKAGVPMSYNASSKIMASSYDMYSLKKLGLFKLDILGLAALDQLEAMRRYTGQEAPTEYDDPRIFQAFTRLLLSEIFQMDGYAAQSAVKQLGINDFEDIVAINTLVRPGAAQFIPVYKGGYELLLENYPQIESVIGYSRGLILYQEQVMEICRILADFNDAEQDDVKEGIKYFQHDVFENKIGPLFRSRCEAKDIDPQLMWDAIKQFSGYSFNRAHAVTYAAIAYKMMWYKVYYPGAYYAAVFDDCKDKRRLIAESQRLGVKWLPPDINESLFGTILQEGGNVILLGLGSIKGLGNVAYEAVQWQRAMGPYSHLEDFYERAAKGKKKINAGVQRRLLQTYALGSLGGEGDEAIFFESYGFFPSMLNQDTWQNLTERRRFFGDLGGFLTATREHNIKKGQNEGKEMAYLSVLNLEGEHSAVVFPEVWKKMKRVMPEVGVPVVVHGIYSDKGDLIAEGLSLVGRNGA